MSAQAAQERVDAYGVAGARARGDLLALAELAAHVCHVPAVGVHLVTGSGQAAVATYGARPGPAGLVDSVTALLVRTGEPLFVADVRRDDRFAAEEHDGTRFCAAQPLRTPDGIVVGACVLTDAEPRTLTDEQRRGLRTVADRVVDALELGRRTAELAAARACLSGLPAGWPGTFADRAAHDLRNPLTAASMSLQMLQEQVGDDSDAAWLVERALSGVHRVDALIERLVEYAKAGGGLRTGRVEAAELVGRVRKDLEPLLADADLRVDGPLPALCGDADQLLVALAHLVRNAVVFTRPVRRPVVVVAAERAAAGWRLEVGDNGPGVPPEDRERVFEPLVRGDKRLGGAGLGLAVCRRVVAAHGGAMGIDASAGGGALVWMELPAAESGELR